MYKVKGYPTKMKGQLIRKKGGTDTRVTDTLPDASTCWYCETRPTSQGSEKVVTLNNGMTQRVVTLPRCQTCENLLKNHRKRRAKTDWINVIFFFAYLTAIVLLVSRYGLPRSIAGTFVETLFWIVVAAVPIVVIIATNVRTLRKSISNCKQAGVTFGDVINKHYQHPAVKELTDNGWELGGLPSGR